MKERIEATSSTENSGDAKVGNRSRSDYLALKNTDDMFKGGIEQNDLPDEMLPNTTLSFKNLANWQEVVIDQLEHKFVVCYCFYLRNNR